MVISLDFYLWLPISHSSFISEVERALHLVFALDQPQGLFQLLERDNWPHQIQLCAKRSHRTQYLVELMVMIYYSKGYTAEPAKEKGAWGKNLE